jgi:two-component system, chemotaxis family, protein-glutamate methylesterase/glutaminase
MTGPNHTPHPATAGMDTLGVLVADDSPSARQLLVHIVNSDPRLRVVGEAADGIQTIRLAERLRPDVILMDVMMPLLDGLQATQRIMQTRPTPIVLVSATYQSQDLTRSFEALQAGALTILPKPRGPQGSDFCAEATTLATTVKLMAEVKLVRRATPDPTGNQTHHPRPTQHPAERRARNGVPSRTENAPVVRDADRDQPPAAPMRKAHRRRICIAAIAASTGGPAALATILRELPAATPVPILIVQHITAGFHQGLVSWLDSLCPLTVQLAHDGQPLRPGHVLVAPAEAHLGVTTHGTVELSQAPPVGLHRPSATHLFRSVAHAYPTRAAGVILTGMGDDGVSGLCALKDAAGLVLAQDEHTSVVYGMPRQAVAAGAVEQILPLDQIAGALAAAWEATTP